MSKKHEKQQAMPAHKSYATVMTREGVNDPTQLSAEGQLEHFKRRGGPGSMSAKKRKMQGKTYTPPHIRAAQ